MERRPEFLFDVIHRVVGDTFDVTIYDLIDLTSFDPVSLQ
jgi:hypothetical protein